MLLDIAHAARITGLYICRSVIKGMGATNNRILHKRPILKQGNKYKIEGPEFKLPAGSCQDSLPCSRPILTAWTCSKHRRELSEHRLQKSRDGTGLSAKQSKLVRSRITPMLSTNARQVVLPATQHLAWPGLAVRPSTICGSPLSQHQWSTHGSGTAAQPA